MNKKKTVNHTLIESVSSNLFACVAPLRKGLRYLEAVPGAEDLPVGLMQILFLLGDTGSMTITEISSRLGIAKPNITPMVDRLIEHDYVDRDRDKNDRRVVNVVIHAAGREKLESIKTEMNKHVLKWADTLSPADFNDLAQSLASLAHVLPLIDFGRTHGQ